MKITKLFCVVLAVIMLAGACSVTAFAAAVDSQYPVYAALGDSIPAGFGLADYPVEEGNPLYVKDGDRIAGSYPDLLASALSSQLLPLAHCGFRSVEVMRMLDAGYAYDEYSDGILARYAQCAITDELRAEYIAGVKAADLITLNVGSNDVMTYALYRTAVVTAKEQNDSSIIDTVCQKLSGVNGFADALVWLLEKAAELNATAKTLAELTDAMTDGYTNLKKTWNLIVGKIYEYNPDVTLVAVGMFNPFADLKLTDYSLLSVGKAADSVINLVNVYIKSVSKYARDYIYADVMGTEAYGLPPLSSGVDVSDPSFIVNVHPNAEGHAYMAQKILNVIPMDAPEVSEPETKPETKPEPDKKPAVIGSLVNFVKDSALYKGFTDVSENAWYGKNGSGSVQTAVELGIMSGYGDGLFMPEASIKLCEVIKMAAVARSTYSGDGFVFDESIGGSWYDTYLAYALNEDVIAVGEFTDLEARATRAQMARIFASAMGGALEAVNSVGFDGIPDVSGDGVYDGDILSLYKAGIVEGRDGGYFDPDSSITRAECAALIARICDASARIVK